MSRIVITGAASLLGRRVVALAAADPTVDEVVAVDRLAISGAGPGVGGDGPNGRRATVSAVTADLLDADVKELLVGADAVVHLASPWGPALDDDPEVAAGAEVELARRVLAAAADAAVPTVVLLSTATVYGAWPNNAVPLTEAAALRPNAGCLFAVQKAEVERLAYEWADANPAARLVVLRPARVTGPDRNSWLARAMAAAPTPLADEPPAQFVDLDDLAAAIDVARRSDLSGPVNVAPDGWLTGDEARALAVGTRRVFAPRRLAGRLATFRWRWRLAPTPPGIVPYRWQSWVVANDRIRGAGWEPTHTSSEAYVAGHRAGRWTTLSPSRRQELALGISGGALVGIVVAVVLLVRRQAKRR